MQRIYHENDKHIEYFLCFKLVLYRIIPPNKDELYLFHDCFSTIIFIFKVEWLKGYYFSAMCYLIL